MKFSERESILKHLSEEKDHKGELEMRFRMRTCENMLHQLTYANEISLLE